MKNKKNIFIYLLFILLNKINNFLIAENNPKVVVIIVIDEFGQIYLKKLYKNLSGGIGYLIANGINFTNAFYAHCPCTSAGHTMLSTGTYGYYHGIISNKWYKDKKLITCDNDDNLEKAAVFKPDGTLYDYGRSAKNIMVDGLSDQLIINSYPQAKNHVWALSLKSRAAISMAGKLAKAIWLDNDTGTFTSSKYYFDELPEWIIDFNKKQKVNKLRSFVWDQFYDSNNNNKYNFRFADSYKYTRYTYSLVNKILNINPDEKGKYNKYYEKTPLANQYLIALAKKCFKINLDKFNKDNNRLILWLSLSSLDKVGHYYGPDSKEAIDMVYHMDWQIGQLIKYIYKFIDKEDVLFLLTADHGTMEIPQLLKDFGLDIVHNYRSIDLLEDINKILKSKYKLENIVYGFRAHQFYLDQEKLSILPKKLKKDIYKTIKDYLKNLPGIRNAWTYKELSNKIFDNLDLDLYIKRQIYKKRSGDIFYSLAPYSKISKNKKRGISHTSQYNYDTHVPLIIYQANKFFKKTITQNVYMTQVAPTLAQILNIPRPSSAIDSVLPIFDN